MSEIKIEESGAMLLLERLLLLTPDATLRLRIAKGETFPQGKAPPTSFRNRFYQGKLRERN